MPPVSKIPTPASVNSASASRVVLARTSRVPEMSASNLNEQSDYASKRLGEYLLKKQELEQRKMDLIIKHHYDPKSENKTTNISTSDYISRTG